MVADNIVKGMALRADILQTSLILEYSTSVFLGSLLGVKDISKSKSFGNTGKALGFEQKITLLTDIEAFTNELRSKFEMFMAVRNQLVHNIDANSMESCALYIEGLQKYLFKRYPQKDELRLEHKLREAFRSLSIDLLKELQILRDRAIQKITEEESKDAAEAALTSLLKTLETIEPDFSSYIVKILPDIELPFAKEISENLNGILYKKVIDNWAKLHE